MDFVLDQLAIGRKFRILALVDTFKRLSPIIDPRFSYRSEDGIETVEQACCQIGYRKAIRVDQGSELISHNRRPKGLCAGCHAGLLPLG